MIKKSLEKELEILRKQEAFYQSNDVKNKDMAKVLDKHLVAVRSGKQLSSETVRNIYKFVTTLNTDPNRTKKICRVLARW